MTRNQVTQHTAPNSLVVRNQQRDCPLNTPYLKQLFRDHLAAQLGLGQFQIAVHLVSSHIMAEVNQEHLNHQGATDVITFNYQELGTDRLLGDMLICPAVARKQAREFETSWQSEIVRYFIHGILHLQGHDDQRATDRRIMKREEDRRLRVLLSRHPLYVRRITRKPTGVA